MKIATKHLKMEDIIVTTWVSNSISINAGTIDSTPKYRATLIKPKRIPKNIPKPIPSIIDKDNKNLTIITASVMNMADVIMWKTTNFLLVFELLFCSFIVLYYPLLLNSCTAILIKCGKLTLYKFTKSYIQLYIFIYILSREFKKKHKNNWDICNWYMLKQRFAYRTIQTISTAQTL